MTILQLQQGHYRDLTGIRRDDALAMFAEHAEQFLEKHPQCRQYWRPSWLVREVPDERTAPWGHEWYAIDEAGVLRRHSAHYDSSD